MIYSQKFTLTDRDTDCFGVLKLSALLMYAQEISGQHCHLLGVDADALAQKQLFWAVTRHRVQITRLPQLGETVTLETWPMPTSRVAYPRSVVAWDSQGRELFRCLSLWVLMDRQSRAMVLPGKSGIFLEGQLRGGELSVPHSLVPREPGAFRDRTVTYSCLDRNLHMNNTRYLDWAEDLLPASFHRTNRPRELVVCYLSEALEDQDVRLFWDMRSDGCFQVDGQRLGDRPGRIFSVQVQY